MNIPTFARRGLAVLSLSVLGLGACDKKDTIIEFPDEDVVVTVSPANMTIEQGSTGTLIAVVTGDTNQNVTWASSNTAVATVSNAGVVTAVAPGTATITATSTVDATARGAALVTVTPRQTGQVTITLAPTSASINPGQTVQLVGVVSGNANTAITYRSSTPAVATVNASGLVTGVAPGTAIITALAAADTTKRVTATITVSALNTVVAITPTVASVGVGGTQQFVATVSGNPNTAVTFRTSNPAVATVTNAGIATGVAAGTAVITAVSVADTLARATATLTVVGASVAISTVPTTPQTAGSFIIQANVSVPAGTADSLMIRLTNTTTNVVYTLRCQTFTAAGAATTVNCPINPADIDPNTAGAQILPNGTYNVQAVLLRQNQVAATATWAQPLVTNYQNTVFGSIVFDNSLNDTDNDPANTTATNAGNIWWGGSATLTITPSVFAGNAIATLQVIADQNCDGIANDPDGAGPAPTDAIRTVTITNGVGTVTFSEANTTTATTPGIDNVEIAGVCFFVVNPLDAQSVAVALDPIGAGQGSLFTAGTTSVFGGAGQNRFRIDNVEAGAFVPTLPAAVLANNNYAGTNTTFSTTTVGGLAAADGGVGGVTYRFFAVPSANLVVAPTQAQYATSITSAGAVEIASASALPESTVANNAYTLVIEAKDALGNVRYNEAGDFGVDLTLPTIVFSPTVASAANNSTNPAAEFNFDITDTFSGPQFARARMTVHSVLEVDADAGTEIQCITDNAGTLAALPASGVCPTFDVPVVDVPGTTETAAVNLPNAVGVEGYIVSELWSVDRAGNQTATALTRTVLMDLTAPAGTIDQYTVITSTNSISLNGTINENVDLASYDVRYNFALTTVPTQVPFTAATAVDTYGLPLTGVLTVTGQNAINIREIVEGAATFTPNSVGFGAWDVAGNFAYINQAIAFGGGGNGTTLTAAEYEGAGLNQFDLDLNATNSNALVLDRSAGPTSTSLTAVVEVAATAQNPISLMYFYYVHPGSNGAYGGGDDYLVLLGSTSSAAVITGVTERTFTYTFPVTATVGSPFPIDAFQYRIVALAVDAQGDAILSDIPLLTIQP